MSHVKRDHKLYAVAISTGLLVWISLSLYSGRKEAWDTPEYFTVGFPIMCIVVGTLAAIEPERPWRWAFSLFLAQIIWCFLSQGTVGNLWPIAIFFQMILFVPLLVAAGIGALIGRRRLEKLHPNKSLNQTGANNAPPG